MILEDEVVEAQAKVLEDLDVELELRLITLLGRLLDLESDIFDHWINDLAQDFFPESLAEGLVVALKNLL